MEMKICTKRNIEKEATNKFFYKAKKGKYGLQAVCKVCRKQYDVDNKEHLDEYQKQYHLDNKQKHNEISKKCREDNPEYFKEYHKQHYQENKAAIKKKNKQWATNNPKAARLIGKMYRNNNPEKTKARHRKWKKNNPNKVCAYSATRRGKKLNQRPEFTPEEQVRYDFIFEVASTMRDYHTDHIHPLSKGGLDHPDNLQILHKTLNLQKGSKWPLTPEEQIKYKGYRIAQSN